MKKKLDNNIIYSPKGAYIVPLGEELVEDELIGDGGFSKKLARESIDKIASVWGTLGWGNNSSIPLKGDISFSEKGNLNSSGNVLEQIKTIYEFNPLLKGNSNLKVTERYINLDEVDFGFSEEDYDIEELPELRLTLFLQPDEGAIVYYQHSDSDDYNDENADIDFILPEATDPLFSTNRDRLDYFFNIIPKFEPKEKGNNRFTSTAKAGTSFVIKILTYPRNPGTAYELAQEAANTLNKLDLGNINKLSLLNNLNVSGTVVPNVVGNGLIGQSKHKLWKFNASMSKFELLGTNLSSIDFQEKTLLLLHGTFSDTYKSFKGLIPELKKLATEKGYTQILAFDHSTIFYDAFGNAKVLYDFLQGQRFSQPVSLIGTSRGALLAKWLAKDNMNSNFEVDKIITVSGANGVDYFTAGNKLSKILTIFKKLASPGAAKIVLAFAQFSAKSFLELPGCMQMTPKSNLLDTLLKKQFKSSHIQVLAIAADWDKSLSNGWMKKHLLFILDRTISIFLGKKHDWVVNFDNQQLENNVSLSPRNVKSLHTRNFDSGQSPNANQIIYDFL